jgi:hypothetical protein
MHWLSVSYAEKKVIANKININRHKELRWNKRSLLQTEKDRTWSRFSSRNILEYSSWCCLRLAFFSCENAISTFLIAVKMHKFVTLHISSHFFLTQAHFRFETKFKMKGKISHSFNLTFGVNFPKLFAWKLSGEKSLIKRKFHSK